MLDLDTHVYLDRETIAPYLSEGWRFKLLQSEFRLYNDYETYALGPPPPAATGCSTGARLTMVPVQMARMSVWSDPKLAGALAEATNEYLEDTYGEAGADGTGIAYVVNSHDPAAGARAVESTLQRPGLRCLLLPLRATALLGDPSLAPLYAAAQSTGVPLMVHPSGAEGQYFGGQTLGGGVPRTPYERFSLRHQVIESNLFSLIFSGTLEEFPHLRFLLCDWGIEWLGSFAWRLEKEWQNFRMEVPWVKEHPREYLQRHVRIAGHPATDFTTVQGAQEMLELIGGERLYVLGTGLAQTLLPPGRELSLSGLPEALRERMVEENWAGWLQDVSRPGVA